LGKNVDAGFIGFSGCTDPGGSIDGHHVSIDHGRSTGVRYQTTDLPICGLGLDTTGGHDERNENPTNHAQLTGRFPPSPQSTHDLFSSVVVSYRSDADHTTASIFRTFWTNPRRLSIWDQDFSCV
jgi:hypothetical protein